MNTINIQNLTINLTLNNDSNPISGLIAHLVRSGDAVGTTHSAPVGASQDTATDVAGDTLEVGDIMTAFNSSLNFLADGDTAEIIEVGDDYFRVKGFFTSKGDKGRRSVTLKVYDGEVDNGNVTFTLAD